MKVRGFRWSVLALSFFATPVFAEPITVPYVDLSRYAGVWYQIARKNAPFETGCVCSRQALTPMPSGAIEVYNSCNERVPSGALREIRGVATIDDPVSNARLSVDFGLPSKGSYWIVGLEENYRYAVVTDNSGYIVYVLAKTPTLPPLLLEQALAEAGSQLDISGLSFTQQEGCAYP